MEENTKAINRRGSRSSSLEESIRMISSSMKDDGFSLDEFQSQIVNNNLNAELRPLLWKISFRVLRKNQNLWNWYLEIKRRRKEFEELSNDENITQLIKFFKKEQSNVEGNKFTEVYNNVILPGLENLKKKYDLFKSDKIGESLIRVFLTGLNNYAVADKHKVFSIVSGLIYSLYPSILHFSQEIEEVTEENISAPIFFYYLNNEESFDADIYMLVNEILYDGSFSKYICEDTMQTRYLLPHNLENLEVLVPSHPDYKYMPLNRIEYISYVLLQILNKDLLKTLISKDFPIYYILNEMFGFLFSNVICLSKLTFLWDNIFFFSDPDFELFNFIRYPLAVFAEYVFEKAQNYTGDSSKLLNEVPFEELDLQEIVKKSLKTRDKFDEETFEYV